MNRPELADAMIKGKNTLNVKESKGDYIRISYRLDGATCFACALGCALIGKLDGDCCGAETILNNTQYVKKQIDEHNVFSELLRISPSLAIDIEHKHLNGQTIEQIARWLKSDPDWAEGWEANQP